MTADDHSQLKPLPHFWLGFWVGHLSVLLLTLAKMHREYVYQINSVFLSGLFQVSHKDMLLTCMFSTNLVLLSLLFTEKLLCFL